MSRCLVALSLVALLATACDDDVRRIPDTSVRDAGLLSCEYEETDAGMFVPVELDAATDAATVDTGAGMDTGSGADAAADSGVGGADSGAGSDAGADSGAGGDAGADAGAGSDAGADSGTGSDAGADAAAMDAAMDAGAAMDGAADSATMTDAASDSGATTDTGPPSDAGGGRVADGLVLLYTFEEGAGAVVRDVSGVEPALDLVAADPERLAWGPGALRITDSTILTNDSPATKVVEACTESGFITIEAWVRPAVLDQSGPARIFTLSEDTSDRNFTLGQAQSRAVVRLRTGATSVNGIPSVVTPRCSFVPRLTHVVYTYGENGVVTMYVDGEVAAGANVGVGLDRWNPEYTLAIGNEHGGERTWLGDLHLIAVYCRTLSAEEVSVNFGAGPR